MKRPILVTSNVLLGPQGLLLGLRSDLLKWELPGGKVDDETIEQAVHRELLEETGMTVSDAPMCLGFGEMISEKGDRQRYVLIYFLNKKWKGFPQRVEPEKCLEWTWFPLDGLPPLKCMTLGTAHFVTELLPIAVELVKKRKKTRSSNAVILKMEDFDGKDEDEQCPGA